MKIGPEERCKGTRGGTLCYLNSVSLTAGEGEDKSSYSNSFPDRVLGTIHSLNLKPEPSVAIMPMGTGTVQPR